MHDCQKFREDWIDGTSRGVIDCEECRSFCNDADLILLAATNGAPPIPEFSEDYWNGMEVRLRKALVHENASRTFQVYWKWSGVAAAAAIVMVAGWTLIRTPQPVQAQIEIVDSHIQGLDPQVVSYLEQSERFLRDYTKIEPSDVLDIDDSRARARESLREIPKQKELAGNFAPVQITLDEYENVLREIKNSDTSEDFADIQKRVLSDGLIANMKAYQPQVMLVSRR